MRLSEPIYDIDPIPLNSDPSVPVEGQELISIGGGRTSADGPTSDVLLEGRFVALSQETCAARLDGVSGAAFNLGDILCVDPGPNDESICNGDSGGPLFTLDGVQVGVTSFGVGCEADLLPDGFARVSYFYDWIQDMICEISNDPPSSCPPPPAPAPNAIDLELTIAYDFDSHEITFNVRSQVDGSIVYAGPYYVPEQAATVSSIISLPPGAYTLEMYDNFKGDGLQCVFLACLVFPSGSWTLTEVGGSLLASGDAEWDDFQSTDFQVIGPPTPPPTPFPTLAPSPSPTTAEPTGEPSSSPTEGTDPPSVPPVGNVPTPNSPSPIVTVPTASPNAEPTTAAPNGDSGEDDGNETDGQDDNGETGDKGITSDTDPLEDNPDDDDGDSNNLTVIILVVVASLSIVGVCLIYFFCIRDGNGSSSSTDKSAREESLVNGFPPSQTQAVGAPALMPRKSTHQYNPHDAPRGESPSIVASSISNPSSSKGNSNSGSAEVHPGAYQGGPVSPSELHQTGPRAAGNREETYVADV